MEDVVATVPRFLKVPIQMLTGDRGVVDPLSKRLNHLTTHFFGVYDGHGGSQMSKWKTWETKTNTKQHRSSRWVGHLEQQELTLISPPILLLGLENDAGPENAREHDNSEVRASLLVKMDVLYGAPTLYGVAK
uniref:Putative PPM-type phosphatase domain-containing protein n=1 Tax=Helianthus annuus TaxID=4232 RepID=A0A251TSF6_HELAN